MKVTFTFEIDVPAVPAYNAPTADAVPEVVLNLGSWLHELHLANLMRKQRYLARPDADPVNHASMVAYYDADLSLSTQLFHNIRISGTTDDGHAFEYVGTEVPMKQETKVDGVVVWPK